jgi:nitroreductase
LRRAATCGFSRIARSRRRTWTGSWRRAAGLGIGSCHAGVADMQLARDLPGFPGDRDWAFLISLGYPADRPLAPARNPDRRPFSEVVHRGRW